MRKFWLLTALLLLCSALVVAQSTSPSASSNSSQVSTSASSDTDNAKTIEGCLSGSAGNWTLTDSSGKTYQLQGDDSKFSKEVGHQVKINGKEVGASASATTSSGATATASTGKSENPPKTESNPSSTSSPSGSASAAIQFEVKTVDKVADNCSNK